MMAGTAVLIISDWIVRSGEEGAQKRQEPLKLFLNLLWREKSQDAHQHNRVDGPQFEPFKHSHPKSW